MSVVLLNLIAASAQDAIHDPAPDAPHHLILRLVNEVASPRNVSHGFVNREGRSLPVAEATGASRAGAECQPDGGGPQLVGKWVESPVVTALAAEEGACGGIEPAAPDPTRRGPRSALHPIPPSPCVQPPAGAFVRASGEGASR